MMVSRRKILSRSRDNLNDNLEEEDVWYQKEKLFKEHVQEVLDKWNQIDDEIWAKVIVFERNRRVAKAYARVPVLTVNGSDDGFDGMRIGLCGFENPMRDAKTAELKRQIGQGVKIKMDDAGNILVRRYAKSNVYIKSAAIAANEETAIGADVIKQPNQSLEIEKVYKIFDMKKFQSNVNRELSRAYPDRRRLEAQCLSIIGFVKMENDILECPIWIMIVNVVAMDMLKTKMPPVQRLMDIKNRPRIPIPDEDPYSEAAAGSASSTGSSGLGGSGSTGEGSSIKDNLVASMTGREQQLGLKRSEKPPKLPPRDNINPNSLKLNYDEMENGIRMKSSRGKSSDKGTESKKYDDLSEYYCGMRARVPNFAKMNGNATTSSVEKKSGFFSKKPKEIVEKEKDSKASVTPKQRQSTVQMPHPASFSTLYQLHQQQNGTIGTISKKGTFQRQHSQPHDYSMWHAKSFESGIDAEFESPYPTYGRFSTPGRGYVPVMPRTKVFVGEWE